MGIKAYVAEKIISHVIARMATVENIVNIVSMYTKSTLQCWAWFISVILAFFNISAG